MRNETDYAARLDQFTLVKLPNLDKPEPKNLWHRINAN